MISRTRCEDRPPRRPFVLAAVTLCFLLLSPGHPAVGAPAGQDRDRASRRKRILRKWRRRHDDDERSAESFRLFADGAYPAVPRRKVELGRRRLNAFVFEEEAQVETQLRPKEGQVLVFGCAAQPEADGAALTVFAARDERQPEVLSELNWTADEGAASWREVACDLSPYAGEDLRVRFVAELPSDSAGGRVLLADPHLKRRTEHDRPNVILFSVETARRDHLSLYGYERPTTPFLERLAEESVVFEDAYSQCSWTRPSVPSLLSGRYPSQHGAHLPLHRLGDSTVLISELLREHGYTTAAFCTNKLVSRPAFNHGQGFDLFVDEKMNVLEVVKDDVLSWLDAAERRPFFLFVHSFDPHAPYEAPGGYKEFFDEGYETRLRLPDRGEGNDAYDTSVLTPQDVAYVIARYDGEIRYTDHVLGRFCEGLRERGLWEDTLLIITSDHGELLGERELWQHKKGLFIQQLRVPLLIKLPGSREGGTTVGGPASGVDVVPTILAHLDIPVPEGLPGVNLLEGLETGETPRRYHLAQFWPDGLYRARRPHFSVISEAHQYIYAQPPGEEPEEFLFDLVEDPQARRNLAERRPRLRRRLAHLMRQRNPTGGYNIAANGGGRPRTFVGTVRSSATITRAGTRRTDSEDALRLSPDGKKIMFRLSVADGDAVVHFQTDPPNAAVKIELGTAGGGPAPVFLGPDREPSGQQQIEIPARRCSVDAKFGDAPTYPLGQHPGLYIWRQGTPRPEAERTANPEEDTLKSLRDLGYL